MDIYDDQHVDFGTNIVDDCLIVKLPININENSIKRMSEEIMVIVNEKVFKGVIFDFSPVSIIDSYEFNMLRNLIMMINMFGISSIITGLQPGVVSALVYMDVETDKLITYLNVEAGLNYFRNNSTSQMTEDIYEESLNSDNYDISPKNDE